MSSKMIHRITAFIVFLISAFVFLSTAQVTVSFWDCGEFIASSYLLQVPHPPGTPFFILMGKLFTMLPFGDNIAYRVNALSAISSALSVMLLYLSAVKLIRNFRKSDDNEGMFNDIITYLSSAIGALSLAFSSTFWFNATEGEVYAFATLFIAAVVWLLLVWNEKADTEDNEKYLLLISYLIGLSLGVHLMAVLASVSIVMVIVFRKYIDDDEMLRNSSFVFLGHSLFLTFIAFIWWMNTDSNAPSPEEYQAFDSKFKMVMFLLSAVYVVGFRRYVFNKNSIYLPLILGAVALFGTYPGVVKYLPEFISSIGGNSLNTDIAILAAILGLLGFVIYWTKNKDYKTANLVAKCILFIIVGFSSYSLIIIRSNQETPINLNSPKTFPELVSYLNREQYGDFPTFKRRFATEGHQQVVYENYSSDFEFFAKYQMHEMFNRYFAWNYIGRESFIEKAEVDFSKLYAIPFLVGLFGIYFHFRKDWKMASAFMVMFILLGYLTAFYQNQQEPQPRERDYFYVGAFFIFSIWIALGIRGIINTVSENEQYKSYLKPWAFAVILLGIVFIPVRMYSVNHFEQDRSRNYVAWDYAYNLLQSVAPNAVLFTNGDNDTFPLWYLQDVEGVRRDVRVANLSLLNTNWYIKQLKNNAPYGSKVVKMNLSDLEIDRLQAIPWEAREVFLQVNPDTLRKLGSNDSVAVRTGRISWKMPPAGQYGNTGYVRIQDLVVKSIVESNNWERPVYFATTCSEDSKIGLSEYLILEGMAYKVTPLKMQGGSEVIDESIMHTCLFKEPEGYSKNYSLGFKFRGLNDPTIFFDDNHQRLSMTYRNSFFRLALHYKYTKKDEAKVVETLDRMEEKIPRSIMPMDLRLLFDLSQLYYEAKADRQYRELAEDIIEMARSRVALGNTSIYDYSSPTRILMVTYENLKDYRSIVDLLEKLAADYPEDTSIREGITKYKALADSSGSK